MMRFTKKGAKTYINALNKMSTEQKAKLKSLAEEAYDVIITSDESREIYELTSDDVDYLLDLLTNK